jgi:dynein heavy chain
MQLPKLIAEDVPLFNALNSDFFPGLEIPPTDYGEFQKAIEASIEKRSLQVTSRAKCGMKSRENGY